MMPMRTRLRALAIAILTIAGAVACGRNTPAAGTEKTAPPGGGAPAPARSTAKNACRLVDLAQIEAIAKQKLNMLHNIEADDHTVCELSELKTGGETLVAVTVYWTGGKEIARINQAAMSMAKQMLNDDDTDIEEITGSAKVRGLADKAYYSDVMPSWVLKGDVMLEITSPLFSNDQKKAVFMSVSKTALSRL